MTASENEVIVDENSRINSENPENNKLVDSILNLTIFPDPELNNRRQVTCLVEDALGQVAESTVTLEVTGELLVACGTIFRWIAVADPVVHAVACSIKRIAISLD